MGSTICVLGDDPGQAEQLSKLSFQFNLSFVEQKLGNVCRKENGPNINHGKVDFQKVTVYRFFTAFTFLRVKTYG